MQDATSKVLLNSVYFPQSLADISCKMQPQNWFYFYFSKFSTAYSSVLSGYLVGRLTNQSYAIFATFAAYSFPALPNPQSCQTSGNVLNNAWDPSCTQIGLFLKWGCFGFNISHGFPKMSKEGSVAAERTDGWK